MMVMRQLLGCVTVLVVASCGSPQKPGGDGATGGGNGSTEGGGGAVAMTSGGPVSPENVCARIMAVKGPMACEFISGFTLDEAECREDWLRSLEERGPDARMAATQVARCLLDNASCDAMESCINSLNQFADEQDGTPNDFRTCEDSEVYAPVGLPKAEWDQRRGAGAARYSTVTTSKDEPIEVCGIPAQMDWLMAATCDDGSQPFRSRDHAHAARVKNVGPGGRCNSIVDLYAVPCPEGTYDVYIDAYVCPLPDQP
jgi:hypothetical protein